ncbi:50S ribosomal protein L15 [Enterobacteriaceae endosymbiont of Macroplea appendiculata]|uniref:50S ribosomal protein L15 n=1 Tax=Enterobacteriaceae endosymbiont of Macroplea appendiculata TaxID=2675790 RepID=UPI001449C668|nr:50S ribosomal protein L15 [Enterobacteriaceae endosymbiont of Macroplea appendiculata]QJC30868.1 50S ribosomal protein L15 [Enterobacteriaceae endosymbiont of Macroplea appendiculata]
MYVNTFHINPDIKKHKKRLGRGIGSGTGKTCGKGHKGQKARAGHKINRSFEGGQTPLHRRLPKFGFISKRKKYCKEINLNDLSKIDTKDVTLQVLRYCKIINKKIKHVKIINTGILNNSKNIFNLSCTNSVKNILIKLGGKIKE